MDMNSYAIEVLARYQLEERHARAAQFHRARAAAGPRRPLRVALGLALIRVGTWALGPGHRTLAPRPS
jgi:hypothetical protein